MNRNVDLGSVRARDTHDDQHVRGFRPAAFDSERPECAEVIRHVPHCARLVTQLQPPIATVGKNSSAITISKRGASTPPHLRWLCFGFGSSVT